MPCSVFQNMMIIFSVEERKKKYAIMKITQPTSVQLCRKYEKKKREETNILLISFYYILN